MLQNGSLAYVRLRPAQHSINTKQFSPVILQHVLVTYQPLAKHTIQALRGPYNPSAIPARKPFGGSFVIFMPFSSTLMGKMGLG